MTPRAGSDASVDVESSDDVDSGDLADRSTVELVGRLSALVHKLVADELALARAEMAQRAGRAGLGAALFAIAALISVYAIGAVVAGLILVLAELMAAWLAALAVGGLLLAICGLLIGLGVYKLKQATPLLPQQTLASVRADLDEIKSRMRK